MGNEYEFVAQVVRHLPLLTEQERQEWIGNPAGLKKALEAALFVDFVEVMALKEGAGKTKPLLRLLCGAEALSLSACDGTRNLAHAKDVFPVYIDRDLTTWRLDVLGVATPAMSLQVYEQVRNGDFRQMFGSISVDFNSLVMSQHQIVVFCQEHPEWLRDVSFSTFFVFKENGEFFVADVGVRSSGLGVRVYRLGHNIIWSTGFRCRLVCPELSA